MKKKIIITIISITILGVSFFGCKKNEDINIPENVTTAKQLVQFSKPYVERYGKDSKYHIGEVDMILDNNMRGDIFLYYKKDKEDKKGVNNLIKVSIDTNKMKIWKVERDDFKIEKDINFDKWLIDSNQAVAIAKKELEKRIGSFEIKVVSLNGFRGTYEVWFVGIGVDNSKIYYFHIDPYSGEILKVKEQETKGDGSLESLLGE